MAYRAEPPLILMWPTVHPADGLLSNTSSAPQSSDALSGSRKDHFPGEMTNQSHYYPINMMEEISFQTLVHISRLEEREELIRSVVRPAAPSPCERGHLLGYRCHHYPGWWLKEDLSL